MLQECFNLLQLPGGQSYFLQKRVYFRAWPLCQIQGSYLSYDWALCKCFSLEHIRWLFLKYRYDVEREKY